MKYSNNNTNAIYNVKMSISIGLSNDDVLKLKYEFLKGYNPRNIEADVYNINTREITIYIQAS